MTRGIEGREGGNCRMEGREEGKKRIEGRKKRKRERGRKR